MLGRNPEGSGVRGETSGGANAVTGRHNGSIGYGVAGFGAGAGGAEVLGINDAGYGGDFKGKTGVKGIGEAEGGYGGLFEGGKAQLKLTPKSGTGRPRSGQHAKGEVYLDSAASVFVCTKSGTPGTWRKLSSTSA